MSKPGSGVTNIIEPARQTKVAYEVDVVVVGGGPGGHSSAVAAARNGAKTILLERYGHLGGMTTGGLVTMLHALSDGTSEQQIAGLCQEWIDRLDARNAAIHPKRQEMGSTDKDITKNWPSRFFVVEGHIIHGAYFDPEILKCVLNEMVEEAHVKLLLHSWGTQPIIDNDQVKGVIFESKSGRQAILAKTVIDGTGDGDLLALAGEEFDCKTKTEFRTNKAALIFEFANVDFKRLDEFRESNPQQHSELMQEIAKLNGFGAYMKTPPRPGVIHFNMFLPGWDILNVNDLTQIEVDVRRRMLITYDFYKKYVPGFENCFIMTTAPQLGTRGSRRLVGEYTLTRKDMLSGKVFDDTIAVFPALDGVVSPKHPHFHVPYRSLLPLKVNGLLVAGRSFASDDIVNVTFNTISHCIAIGQAAGTAAAVAAKKGEHVRDVDYRLIQDRLLEQGVPLPGLVRS